MLNAIANIPKSMIILSKSLCLQSLIPFIPFYLSEDCLYLYRSFAPMFKPFWWSEFLTCQLLVPPLFMVHPDFPVSFSFMAFIPQRTSLTVPGTVNTYFTFIPIIIDGLCFVDKFHMLPHRAYKVIFRFVIIQILLFGDVTFPFFGLFHMKIIILHISTYTEAFHKLIILLTSISCIRTNLFHEPAVPHIRPYNRNEIRVNVSPGLW